MTSQLETPGDWIWTWNSVVEEIERWSVERARACGLDRDPAGGALVAFFEHKLATGGPGLYGFSVTEPPFDRLDCRRWLAFLVEEMAREMCASAREPNERWRFLHEDGYRWRYPSWLAVLERLHDGIVRSFAGQPDPPRALTLALDDTMRATVDVHRLAPMLQHVRRAPTLVVPPGAPDPTVELGLVTRLIEARQRAARELLRPESVELRTLVAERASLLEKLGRSAEAAAAWREVARIETDPDAAAIARQLAEHLER